MIKNKTLLIVMCSTFLAGCSSVSGLFSESEPERRLEGERISVLELQRSLTPDRALEEGKEFSLPKPWHNTSWPQAGGYPNHSMHNLSLSENKLERVWKADIGQGSTGDLPLNAQPIIADGKIFALDADLRLSAFNAENGKRIWRVDVEHEDEDEKVIGGGIAFAHGTLYITNGYDEVLAVSPDNGDIQWRKRLPTPSRAAPTVINGRLFVTTVDSRLVALSAKDGAGLWEYSGIGESAGLLGAASPGANAGIVVPVFSSGEVTALRVENGSVAWSDNLASVRKYGGGLESLSDIKAMPIVDRGIIIAVSFSGKLAAIDERTGTRIWQKEISSTQTPWVAGNLLFVLSSDNQIVALSMIDGSIFWIKQLPQFEDEEDKEDPIHWSGPVMAGDRLIVAGSNGKLLEISAHNGDITQTVKTGENVQITPIVANNTLFMLSETGRLIAYR
ncbi:MAG: PQQ-binding-like beta-propeller repeat protein [Alphaproteobacteria bacterium]